MKKLSRFLIMASMVTTVLGCSPHIANYTVELTEVMILNESTTRFAEVIIGESKMGCENDLFFIEWDLDWSGAGFILENRSEQSLSIVWDQCVFVDPEGYCHDVLTSDNNYIGKKGLKKSSKVTPKKRISKRILPEELVTFETNVGWVETPYVPKSSHGNYSHFSQRVSAYKGKDISILLAVEQDSQIYEYTFVFEIIGTEVFRGYSGSAEGGMR